MTPLPSPAPSPDAGTRAFWEATRRKELLLARCGHCDVVIWYPRPFCPRCQRRDLTLFRASGRGAVYSFTVARKASQPFDRSVPYVIAYVDLEEGPRVLTNIIDVDPDTVTIGQPVEVVFDPTEAGWRLYRFVPARKTERAT